MEPNEMQLVPNEPLIARLYALCREDGNIMAIYDHGTKENVTRWRFLSDILALSDYVLNALPDDHTLTDPDTDIFICIMMQSQYEQLLAFFAMYVLGATAVLLSPTILPAEAEYFTTLSGAVALVSSPDCADNMNQIHTASNISRILLPYNFRAKSDLTEQTTRLNNDKAPINPEKGLVLLLTSGTTGPPKGVLHSRKSILAGARNLPSMYSLSSSSTEIALLPQSFLWIAGISFYCGYLLAGASVELCESILSPHFFWERIKAGGITVFSSTPPFYSKLRSFLESELGEESEESRERFVQCIYECRNLVVGSGYLADDLSQYWKRLRRGRPLVNAYGSTELTVPFCSTSYHSTDLAPFCVGNIQPGTEVNLRDGEEGELCVKTDSLFKRYIESTPETSADVFDEKGFYKTGDMARREGDTLFILGRVSTDVIRSNSWMVYTPAVESVLLTVPGIDVAVVVGISDDAKGQEQIAALISWKSTTENETITPRSSDKSGTTLLQYLHHYLLTEKNVPVFWLPTILRVLQPNESVPTNIRGKVDKMKTRDKFFNVSLKDTETDITFETIRFGDIAEHDKKDVPWRHWAWDD